MENEKDMLFDECLEFAKSNKEIRPALLQLKFKLGYMKADKIFLEIEKTGLFERTSDLPKTLKLKPTHEKHL